MLNEGSHEGNEPKINMLSGEEKHASVCSEISNTVPRTEEGKMKKMKINPKNQTRLLAKVK